MNKLDSLKYEWNLSESSDVVKKAVKALNLEHYGFGNYGKGGEVTHQSVDGKLLPVKPAVKQSSSKVDSMLKTLANDIKEMYRLNDKPFTEMSDKDLNNMEKLQRSIERDINTLSPENRKKFIKQYPQHKKHLDRLKEFSDYTRSEGGIGGGDEDVTDEAIDDTARALISDLGDNIRPRDVESYAVANDIEEEDLYNALENMDVFVEDEY